MEGLSDAEMRYKICQRMLETGRTSQRFREVDAAIAYARQTCNILDFSRGGRRRGRNSKWQRAHCSLDQQISQISKDTFLAIAQSGHGLAKRDLWEVSNPRPHGDRRDGILFLSTLFAKDDILLLGEKFSKELHTRDQWIDILGRRGNGHPFFIINPLSGNMHVNSSGNMSNRCDAAAKQFKYALVEFDGAEDDQTFSLANQLAFFSKIDLPIVALTYSGNKSIHAIVSLGESICSIDDW
ncbi:MAG: hypothetical protein LBJ75_02480, partial [Puniceicoccales bacterium]|nr:hypothetical protein [Puniceicoccales bacterium]